MRASLEWDTLASDTDDDPVVCLIGPMVNCEDGNVAAESRVALWVDKANPEVVVLLRDSEEVELRLPLTLLRSAVDILSRRQRLLDRKPDKAEVAGAAQ